jgi:hypothetical protein
MTKSEVISILDKHIDALKELMKEVHELQEKFKKYGYRGEASVNNCLDLSLTIQSRMREIASRKKRISSISDEELALIDLQTVVDKACDAVEGCRKTCISLRRRFDWI